MPERKIRPRRKRRLPATHFTGKSLTYRQVVIGKSLPASPDVISSYRIARKVVAAAAAGKAVGQPAVHLVERIEVAHRIGLGGNAGHQADLRLADHVGV